MLRYTRPLVSIVLLGSLAVAAPTRAATRSQSLNPAARPASAVRPSRLQTTPTESVLYAFKGAPDGSNPYEGLVGGNAAAHGVFYGTTLTGGTGCAGSQCGLGTVFSLTPAGSGYTESVLYNFQGGSDGQSPVGGLIRDKRGRLYGTTFHGGAAGWGTVFKLTPARTGYEERVLYSFCTGACSPNSGPDGALPEAGLYMDSTGALYGTTNSGGSSGAGTIFKLTPARAGYTESVLYSFKAGSDGYQPEATLVADPSGALYGTTVNGGDPRSSGFGTVYKLTPSGSGYTESVLHAFKRGVGDGVTPQGPVILDPDGAVYGTTVYGGSALEGSVYKLTPTGSHYTESVLYSFTNCRSSHCDGAAPMGGLLRLANGALYGMTAFGGAGCAGYGGCGTVFKLTPAGSGYKESVTFSFQNSSSPSIPVVASSRASLIERSGALYGTTFSGGNRASGCESECGTVFKLSQ
jgi:uncharacterized repeat protein (TIGR03803 family)